ncbi:MAG: hypothetical protein QM754_09990 [Tepidisphaeraceae bacterium]
MGVWGALFVLLGMTRFDVAAGPATQPGAVLIHLPGIAGEMSIDHSLVRGLVAGGVAANADVQIIDWTGTDRGVRALNNVDRHREQAQRVADEITAIHTKNPAMPIILVGHSGGTGVAAGCSKNCPPA